MSWVLGVDGGGTKTLLALADRQGRVLGPLAAGGTNPFDNPAWRDNLEQLLGRCPRPLSEVAQAALGLPGYGEVPATDALQERAVQGLIPAPHALHNDVAAAFAGALGGGPGVLVLAGTGSMAWGEAGGRQVRVGGWGDGFGDEGSAFWIGQQALGDLSKALDGRIHDPAFAAGVLRAAGASDGAGLLAWYYGLGHARSEVARLAQAVDALAEAGNPTAARLLERGAAELAFLAQTARRLLADPQAGRFSRAGGVFGSRTLLASVRSRLAALGEWQEPLASPVAGALLLAARRAGWEADPAWLGRVEKGLQGALV